MTLELAIRLTEVLLGLALIQHSLEHLVDRAATDRALAAARLALAAPLVLGVAQGWACLALLAHAAAHLSRYDGPYNGGADRMAVLCLACLSVARWAPGAAEAAMGYLAGQLLLSYAVAGWVKLANPDWRSGQALRDVFLFSAYPVSEQVRGLAARPRLLRAGGWAVMLLEGLFPLAMLHPLALAAALAAAAAFHLANAALFGLNRFVWAWLAAYPSVIWLQARLLG